MSGAARGPESPRGPGPALGASSRPRHPARCPCAGSLPRASLARASRRGYGCAHSLVRRSLSLARVRVRAHRPGPRGFGPVILLRAGAAPPPLPSPVASSRGSPFAPFGFPRFRSASRLAAHRVRGGSLRSRSGPASRVRSFFFAGALAALGPELCAGRPRVPPLPSATSARRRRPSPSHRPTLAFPRVEEATEKKRNSKPPAAQSQPPTTHTATEKRGPTQSLRTAKNPNI